MSALAERLGSEDEEEVGAFHRGLVSKSGCFGS